MLLTLAELASEVRVFEAAQEIISDEAAATVANFWYSVNAPQLTMLATHADPFADERFDLDQLEVEARTEHKLMMINTDWSDRDKARFTRQFEALYAWIADKQLDVWATA